MPWTNHFGCWSIGNEKIVNGQPLLVLVFIQDNLFVSQSSQKKKKKKKKQIFILFF